MMKRFLIGLILVTLASSFGMVYLEEGFESGTLDNVTLIDDDADTNNWQIAASTKEGSWLAESVSSGLTPDNSMVFQSTLVEQDTYIRFAIGTNDETNFGEHYAVYLALDYIDPTNFIVVHEETLESSGMKTVEIDLKPYLFMLDEYFFAENATLKIRHFDSDGQGSLLLDDFMILYYPTFAYDDAWWTIIPQGVVEPYKDIYMRWWPYDMSAYDYMGDWSFLGYNNPIELHYIISNAEGSQPEQIIEMTLNTDPDYPETFFCTAPGMEMGTFMEYWAEVTDNTAYSLVGKSEHFFIEWGEVNFNQGFEYDGAEITPPAGWMPDGWSAYQIGDVTSSWDTPWEVDVPQQNVHSGEYSVTSAAQNNFGVWLTEDYLVSPRLRVNGTPTLRYFINAQTKAGEDLKERWSVLISLVDGDGTDIENFTEIARDSIIPTIDNLDSWYEKSFYLGDYQDEQIRVMWKHYYTATGTKLDRYLNIDDISIAEMPVIILADNGNTAIPGEDFVVNITATDYSGINNATLYYTIAGEEEISVVMNDNGDGTFTGLIPGQLFDARCSWYVIVTDDSAYSNTTTTETQDVIWFESGCIQYGNVYDDDPEPLGAGNKVAIDFDFGAKGHLYLNRIEIGLTYDGENMSWKLVEFDPTVINPAINEVEPIGAPTENIIGELHGTNTFKAGGDYLDIDGNFTPIYGNVALVFDIDQYNELSLDEDGDKSHAWQYNPVNLWTTNKWGAFYIKMYVSQTVGIEDEFVSSTTELCQNYPNPFNPTTSISFYNRIAGDVSLTVYNTKGEKVTSLINERLSEGFRKIEFNASKLNSGVYYYTLKTPEKTLTKKMILIK